MNDEINQISSEKWNKCLTEIKKVKEEIAKVIVGGSDS
jgi:hypothetical protein